MDENQVIIVRKAMESIDGFEKVFQVIYQQSVLQGKSKSTFNNYIRRIALISPHAEHTHSLHSELVFKDKTNEG